MEVETADERILLLNDGYSMDLAEGRAWAKRSDCFGVMGKITGFLSKPKDEEFSVVYRERRLQPFWRIACTANMTYERKRTFSIPVDANVTAVDIAGTKQEVDARSFALEGVEHCHDEIHREVLYDAISGVAEPELAVYLKHEAQVIDAEALAAAGADAVVVPPQAKASHLVRDVLASAIARIDADTVHEERLALHHVDLYYRPVYAFRFRWQGKEAVVEFDGVTGTVKIGGTTFEQYVDKMIDPRFLIDVGVEAVQIFLPGARIADLVISKTLQAREAKHSGKP